MNVRTSAICSKCQERDWVWLNVTRKTRVYCAGVPTFHKMPHSSRLVTSPYFLTDLDTTWLVLIIVAACISVAVVGVYLEEVFFIMKNLRQWRMRNKVLYLLGLYPVSCLATIVNLNSQVTLHVEWRVRNNESMQKVQISERCQR